MQNSFFYVKPCGWAHVGEKPVRIYFLTARHAGMSIPGGALLFGMEEDNKLKHIDAGINPVPVNDDGRHEKDLLQFADSIRKQEWLKLGSTFYYEGENIFILSFTEEHATVAAYNSGLRVKPYGYVSASWPDLYHHQKYVARMRAHR